MQCSSLRATLGSHANPKVTGRRRRCIGVTLGLVPESRPDTLKPVTIHGLSHAVDRQTGPTRTPRRFRSRRGCRCHARSPGTVPTPIQIKPLAAVGPSCPGADRRGARTTPRSWRRPISRRRGLARRPGPGRCALPAVGRARRESLRAGEGKWRSGHQVSPDAKLLDLREHRVCRRAAGIALTTGERLVGPPRHAVASNVRAAPPACATAPTV